MLRVVCITIYLFSWDLWAGALPFPPAEQAIITLTARPESFVVNSDSLYSLDLQHESLFKRDLSIKFDPLDEFAASVSLPAPYMQNVRGRLLANNGDKLLFFNSRLLYASVLTKAGVLHGTRSIVYDRIRPPVDRGGEAPNWEVSDLRTKFMRSLNRLRTKGLIKLSGVEKIPANLDRLHKFQYLVASKIPDFQLLGMHCDDELGSRCEISRACFVHLPLNGANIVGLARYKSWLLFADQEKHRLAIVRYRSCLHSEIRGYIELPSKIKQMSAVQVDAVGKLWISSLWRDDYHNANIYFWPKAVWLSTMKKSVGIY